MAIFEGSRYVGGEIVVAPDWQGVNHTTVQRAAQSAPLILEQIRADQFTRLDSIAQVLFGDPTQWWRIADANPQIAYPDEFTIGEVLNIPYATTSSTPILRGAIVS
jgi:hypothetical protein